MSQSLRVGLVSERHDRIASYSLLAEAYKQLGTLPEGATLWLTKRHMLPSTATIAVWQDDKVVVAATIFNDSPMRLPIEAQLSIQSYRAQNQRCAEVSTIAVDASLGQTQRAAALSAIFRYMLLYCGQYLGLNHLFEQFPQSELKEALPALAFSEISIENRVVLYKNLTQLPPPQELYQAANDNFLFPERASFELQDSYWRLADFTYFFSEQTQLLAEANDLELRMLQNIYDSGDFRALFDGRRSIIGSQRNPMHLRFPIQCSGQLIVSNDKASSIEIIDASRAGMRVFIPNPPVVNKTYVLKIELGPMKKCEVIAKAVWVKPRDNTAGLQIISSDASWNDLITHLENKQIKVSSKAA